MATVSTTFAESTATLPIAPRLLTAADLAVMPEQLPTGAVSYELHHGRLVPMSPPAARHGNLQARFGFELMLQGEKKGLGSAYTEVGVHLAHKPDHVLGPDAAFVTRASHPVKLTPEGFLETIPELIVEIRSKNDTSKEIAEKVADYLKAGSLVVWVAEPTSEIVIEHRRGQTPKSYLKPDALTCADIIPGFRLPLAELFLQ